jgi:hypothetical protein
VSALFDGVELRVRRTVTLDGVVRVVTCSRMISVAALDALGDDASEAVAMEYRRAEREIAREIGARP